MEREIKFRAWDKNLKLMTTPFIDFLVFEKSDNFKGGQVLKQNFEDEDFIPTEIMQFTGLYDKNYMEIYEGDILDIIEVNSTYTKGIVIFHSGCFSVKQIGAEGLVSDLYRHRWSEVIGNIYENTELLKTEQP